MVFGGKKDSNLMIVNSHDDCGCAKTKMNGCAGKIYEISRILRAISLNYLSKMVENMWNFFDTDACVEKLVGAAIFAFVCSGVLFHISNERNYIICNAVSFFVSSKFWCCCGDMFASL
jgi:hypothetical protein